MIDILASTCRRAIPERLREHLSWLKRRVLAQRARRVRSALLNDTKVFLDSSDPPRKVFFIVLDCLRRDALSLYGSERCTTPFLDSLVAERSSAIALRNFYGSSNWTYPAVASMLSGLYPHHHGAIYTTRKRRFNEGQVPNKMRDDVILLPEVFEKLNYSTYFASSNVVAFEAARGAFAQHYADPPRKEPGGLFQWIGRRALRAPAKRQFFYCHDMTLHEPLMELPEPFDAFFDSNIGKLTDSGWEFKDGEVDFEDPEFRTYSYRRRLHYDRCLRWVDTCLELLFDTLRRAHLLNECLFVITADHGEEFWDHVEMEKGRFYDPSSWGIAHGHNFFQEAVHLPCIIWKNRLVEMLDDNVQDKLLSHVDLFNLVCHLSSVSGTWGDADGIDFGDPASEHPWVLAEDVGYGFEKKAVIRPPHKLLVSEGDGVKWLFNIEEDPHEQHPLDGPASVIDELSAALPQEHVDTGAPMETRRRTLKKLRELGYID